jgi:hypothetical protein
MGLPTPVLAFSEIFLSMEEKNRGKTERVIDGQNHLWARRLFDLIFFICIGQSFIDGRHGIRAGLLSIH